MGVSIFTFLDDIAALMDDVAVASKVATKKTAAILGDDLAVNAEKATGYAPSRELPVLWAISKGSFINKLIIVPLILILNLYAPFVIKILLVIGGIYLSYEGAEKIIELVFHKKHKHLSHVNTTAGPANALTEEKKKVSAAIKTDFILSLEIVIIALSTVLDKNLLIQIMTVSVVALIATVGVYGLVAILVRMDDMGYRLIHSTNGNKWASTIGTILVKGLPVIVRTLEVLGTIALILVSGGIFIHYIDYFHGVLTGIPLIVREIFFGLAIGTITVILVSFIKPIFIRIGSKRQRAK
ncbi:MAG: DUF808 family protein [Bacteroidetes bacterium]|nr:DUF808 family protein [Bacteroidota bacterium]